jgi:peptide/nickel transport system substrate-binding protein
MKNTFFAAALFALAASVALPASAQDTGKTLTWSAGDQVGSLDIDASLEGTSRRLLKGNVGEGLTKVVITDGKLSWEPLLATSWEHVEPTRWRFKLRDGVKFQDGTPMTADDVVFSINKVADPASSKTSILQNIAGAEKVDDHTVDVLTKSPDFFAFRAVAEIVIQPNGWGKLDPKLAQTTLMGTGPYKLDSVSPGRDLAVLTRNDAYWGAQPYFDSIKLRVIPDSGARLAALNAGEIDVAFDLAPDLAQAAPAALSTSATEVDILRINAAKPPLDDVRVRQALNYAVDQKVLIDNVRLGFAQLPNGQAVTGPVHGYNPAIKDYGFDLAKATALIDAAGAKGATLSLMCPSEYYGAVGVDTCQTLQAMYQAIGLKIDLQFLPHDRWIKEGLLAPHNKLTPPDLFYIEAGSETLDATPYIRNYLTCNQERSTICEPELDKQARAALETSDEAAQGKAYQQVLSLAHDRAVMVWLTNPTNTVAVGKGISGPVYNEGSTVYWADWSRTAN